MNRKRNTPEQIIRELRDADRLLSEGKDIALVCQEPIALTESLVVSGD